MKLPFEITKIVVVVQEANDDIVYLTMDCPKTFPAMGYPSQAQIHCAHRTGVEWCRANLREPDSIVDVVAERTRS